MDDIRRLLKYMAGQSPHAADLTRRRFIADAGKFGLTAAAAATLTRGFAMPAFAQGTVTLPEITSIPDALKGSGVVRYCSYGGALQDAQREAYLKPFQELSGIEVIESVGPDAVKIKAMVDTGNLEYDIAENDAADVLNLASKSDYWEPLDYSLFDTANIDEIYRSQYYIDMLPYAQIYAYRTDAFDSVPQDNKDLFDLEKFPGPRSMQSGGGGLSADLEVALMADGVTPADLYPIDMERAYTSLGRIKPDVVKWWEAGAVPAQLLTDDEVVMATAWNGRIYAAQQAGAPLEIVWKDQLMRKDCWSILKGAPNAGNAQKLAAFITLAAPQARLSMLIPYGFVNNGAEALIPAERLAILPTSSAYKSTLINRDTKWWLENADAALDRWNKFILE